MVCHHLHGDSCDSEGGAPPSNGVGLFPGSIPWWNIFLYFLGSLLFFFLIVLGTIYGLFRCCKTMKDVLNPSDQMPSHLKKVACS